MADWQRQRERETKQFEEHCDQRTSEIEAKKWELEKQTEALGKDKDEFQAELQVCDKVEPLKVAIPLRWPPL